MADALSTAKTLAIVTDPPEGDPYVTAGEVVDFTAERLSGWKRLRVVARAGDLLLRVTYRRLALRSAEGLGYRVVVQVTVVAGADTDGPVLWQDGEEKSSIPGAGAGGAHGNAWKRMLPVVLKRFREAVEKAR